MPMPAPIKAAACTWRFSCRQRLELGPAPVTSWESRPAISHNSQIFQRV